MLKQIDDIYERLLKRLIKKREKYENGNESMTQSELSKKISKTKSYIGQIERGNIELSYDSFCKLASFYKMDPQAFFEELIKPISPLFTITRFKSKSAKDKPTEVYRYGQDGNNLHFYSLLDPVENEQKIVTDFQINIVVFGQDSETEKHYHLGDEFSLVLDGELHFSLFTFDHLKSGWMDVHEMYAPEMDYICFPAYIPHFYKSDTEAILLTILNDPRGESGLYSYKEERKNSSQIKYKEDKSKSSSVFNGLGFKLKYHRLETGLSINELAERTGLSSATISRLEKNEVTPSLKQLLKISLIGLDIKPTELFGSEQMNEGALIKSGGLKSQKTDFELGRGNLTIKAQLFKNSTITKFLKVEKDLAIFVVNGQTTVHFGDASNLENETNLGEDNQSHFHHILLEWDTIYVTKGAIIAFEYHKDSRILVIQKTTSK